MVNEKKTGTVKEMLKDVEKYPVVGIVNLYKLPARDLMNIKQKLKGKARVHMVKKTLMNIILEKSKKENIKSLKENLDGQPGFLLSETNPFELAGIIQKSKSKTFAVAGDTAPYDIVVPAGPTSLPAGPAIGELQRAKIKAAIEGGKIIVKQDSLVAEKGSKLTAEQASILQKLGIQTAEIGLNLVSVWDTGLVYSKDILFTPPEKYVNDLQIGYVEGINLSVKLNYYTQSNINIFLSKSHSEAHTLAIKVGYLTKDTIKPILAKAHAEAETLGKAAAANKPADS